MATEAESVKNLLWNLSQGVLVMAANVSITNLTVLAIGHVVHAYWKGLLAQSWAHTSQSIGGNPQNEFRAHRKAMTLTHNLCIQVISKAAFQISPAFFCLPLVSQTFSYLAELSWLPLNRLTRQLEYMWSSRRRSRQMRAQRATPGFCKSTLSTLLYVHKIPLSANLGSSIKRFEIFKYQMFF